MKKGENNNLEFEKIVSENLYMCISTATLFGDPWISQVYFVKDSENNFYWYSSVNAKHSRLIAENNRVTLSLYNSTAVGDDVSALYIKATCKIVGKKSELLKALALYGKKMLLTGFVKDLKDVTTFIKDFRDFLGNSELRLYKATPIEISKLGESKMYNGKYLDRRVAVSLS